MAGVHARTTIWVLGDQLNTRIGALASADPATTTVLLIESERQLDPRRHRQRLHFVVAAMRRFARELQQQGFVVDVRRSSSFAEGIAQHRNEHHPARIVATEPNTPAARATAQELGVELVRSDQFLCHPDDFARWAKDRKVLRMEDFYRWQRQRLDVLIDRDREPVGGRWNFDAENRLPPPKDASVFTAPATQQLDQLDHDVLASLPDAHGANPTGIWATTRTAALARLDDFVAHHLVRFGPYEDAITSKSWHLAHSLLSPYLNIGLLLPREVVDAAERAYRAGMVPLQSAEGFIRQIIGWREYVWGLSWLWPDHIEANALDHHRPLPPVFDGASTHMACVADAMRGVEERAWTHHIQRLMVLSNLANLYGVEPKELVAWFADRFIDATGWVMVPNVIGMALWADGGRMASKPYVSGGAYINRMSDHCKGCRYDPKQRVGETACPFTTLYWDFLARHRPLLARNGRMAQMLANLDRLADLDATRQQAATTIDALADGTC